MDSQTAHRNAARLYAKIRKRTPLLRLRVKYLSHYSFTHAAMGFSLLTRDYNYHAVVRIPHWVTDIFYRQVHK